MRWKNWINWIAGWRWWVIIERILGGAETAGGHRRHAGFQKALVLVILDREPDGPDLFLDETGRRRILRHFETRKKPIEPRIVLIGHRGVAHGRDQQDGSRQKAAPRHAHDGAILLAGRPCRSCSRG